MGIELSKADLARLGPDAQARLAALAPEEWRRRRSPRHSLGMIITPGGRARWAKEDAPPPPTGPAAGFGRGRVPVVLPGLLASLRGLPARQVSIQTVAVVALVAVGVILGLLWSMPRVVPQGWTLDPSLPGRVAGVLVAHMPRWTAALVALSGGAAACKWGGRWLLAAARVGAAVLAVAVCWAIVRG